MIGTQIYSVISLFTQIARRGSERYWWWVQVFDPKMSLDEPVTADKAGITSNRKVDHGIHSLDRSIDYLPRAICSVQKATLQARTYYLRARRRD